VRLLLDFQTADVFGIVLSIRHWAEWACETRTMLPRALSTHTDRVQPFIVGEVKAFVEASNSVRAT